MKKTISIVSVVISACMFFFTSCSFGFEPAWKAKDGNATISLQFNTIDAISRAASSERAIVQGDGYLYIRTLGGPKGSSGPLYGPFAMKPGDKFETNAIPAGSYDNIGFLYCASNMDTAKVTYNGAEYSFRQFLSLPDAEFKVATEGGEGKESPFNELLDGNASGKLYGPVIIKEGKTTTFKMTMEPITGQKSCVRLGDKNSIDLVSDGATLVRKFIRIDGISSGLPEGATVSDIVCALFPDAAGVLGKVILYDKNGTAVPNFTEKEAVPGGRVFKGAYTSGDSLFLYVEFIATSLKIDFHREFAGGSTFRVLFSGGSSLVSKRMFAGLYTSPDPGGMMVGSGILTIAPDGSGEITLLAGGSTQPAFVLKDTTYYLSVLIDVNGNYDNIVDISAPGAADGMMPHFNDLVTMDKFLPVLITGSGAYLSFTPSLFHAYDTHLYFVADAATGNGLGQTPANACTLWTAITNANTVGGKSLVMVTSPVTIPLGGSLPDFGSEIVIQSFGSTPQTISLYMTTSGLNISADVNVSFNNVIVDGTVANRSVSLFTVAVGRLNLFNGTVITNGSTSSSGGAVSVSGSGTLEIAGGTITNCTTTLNGGGVSISTGGTVVMTAGSINNCTSSANGGGIYVNGGFLRLFSTISASAITGNTALSGGGVYSTINNSVFCDGTPVFIANTASINYIFSLNTPENILIP